MNEEEIDKNEIAKEFELIFKGNQAILCISSEFNEDPMLYGVYIIAGRIYSKQRLIMNASFSELQQIAEDLENLLASMRLIIINITHRFYKKEKPTVVSIAYGLFEIIQEIYFSNKQLCELLEPYKTPFWEYKVIVVKKKLSPIAKGVKAWTSEREGS